MMDESMLLPPTNTPLTGIDFTRRLPCGENEKARKTMRVFFALRKLSQQRLGEEEKDLPLTNAENSLKVGDVMDTGEGGREGRREGGRERKGKTCGCREEESQGRRDERKAVGGMGWRKRDGEVAG